jgi:pyridoxine kinase
MTKKAVLINDLSGLGRCSLTASIPVLSVMGIQPCPMPTAVLTNQTGYPTYYCNDCTDKLSHYITEWQALNFKPDGIYTGFLSSENQVDVILSFIEAFSNDDMLIMVDPVMGDSGRTYSLFTDTLADKMKQLVSKADIITPNLTECCILCDQNYSDIVKHNSEDNYLVIVKKLGEQLIDKYKVKTAIITGVVHKTQGVQSICNLVIIDDEYFYTKSLMIGESYSGTGDLFASVVFGGLLNGDDLQTVVTTAVGFIEDSLRDTIKEDINRNDGIEFEKHLSKLIKGGKCYD